MTKTDMTKPDEPVSGSAARRPPPPIPLSILTGFLGAGKTSLLNRILRDPALADTLVIINEFGEIGLDHLLVEKSDDGMLLLSSGCLCCTIRGDLVNTLEDLLKRIDNGRMKPFRRVVIETTGLADPAPILQTIMQHPYLAMRYRLDSVITLVDAVNGEATIETQDEALKQAAVADRIVLTKTDLLDTAARRDSFARLKRRLAAINPGARLLDAARGEAVATALLDAGPYDPATKSEDVRAWLNAEAYGLDHDLHHHHGHRHHDHDHDHGHGHGHGHDHHHDHEGQDPHDVNRHDARIRAFCLTWDKPVPAPVFDLFLELLRNAHGPNLLRVKGLISLADDPDRPVVLHGVQHVFHPLARLDRWPDGDRRTRMVFILRDLHPSFVEKLWSAFTGALAPDAPDRAALTDNPLKPGGGGLLA